MKTAKQKLEFVNNRLTAWAEHHEMKVKNLPDSECVEDRNIAANYRELIKINLEVLEEMK